MKVPVGVKVAGLVLVTTALYTYIGQLVPQKEVPAPQVVQIAKDVTTAELVEIGGSIFNGKGLCTSCHKSDDAGRGPNLTGVLQRAATQVEGLEPLEYIAQSLYEPSAFVVPGREDAMDALNGPPMNLTDPEIRAVMAYLESLSGTPTITMETVIPYMDGQPPVGASPEE